MIKLIVFDMGGVMTRKGNLLDGLMPYLGYDVKKRFSEISPVLSKMLDEHVRGLIDENAFWTEFEKASGRHVEGWRTESLFGKFFHPRFNQSAAKVVQDLKKKGRRVVCGTDVIDAHFKYHEQRNQYALFDKVYASCYMGLRKPDPEFFRFIAEHEKVKLSQMFFVDDLLKNVQSASSLGITVCRYESAKKLRNVLKSLGLL